MVRTSNIAELVPSGILCLQPWFLQRIEHISLRKTSVFMSIQLCSVKKCSSIKIIPCQAFSTSCVVVSIFPFNSGGFGGSSVRPSGGADLFCFSFFFLFFFLVIALKYE